MAVADECEPSVEIPLRAVVEHALAAVPVATPDALAGDVRHGLTGARMDAAHDIVVVEGGRPVGVVGLERLLAADPHRPMRDLMDRDPPAVTLDTDQEAAAHTMVAHGGRCLVVVDDAGAFQGIVPAERMLGVLLAEHDSDLARLGGYVAGASRARDAAYEPVGRRLWHRLPWLLLGLLGAMGATVLVGTYDAQLEANVVVAFFVPAIVYMADAVGTQTETVLIRALAAGVGVRAVLLRELVTGVIVGLVVGAVFFAFAAVGWGDGEVAFAVALALFGSCAIATLVAMALPALFQRAGADPAFGSGPLATVLQDLLSLAVYLAIVTLVAT